MLMKNLLDFQILGTLIALSKARPDIGLELQKYQYEKPGVQLTYNTQSAGTHVQAHSHQTQDNRFGAPTQSTSTFQHGGQDQGHLTSYEHSPSGPAQTQSFGSTAGSNQFGIDSNGISTASGQGYQIIHSQASHGDSHSQGFGSTHSQSTGSFGSTQSQSSDRFGSVQQPEPETTFSNSQSQTQLSQSSGSGHQSSGFGGNYNQASSQSQHGSGSNVVQGQSNVLNIATGSTSSGGIKKVIRPVIKAGQPIIKKSFYVHAAPEDDEEEENVQVEDRVQTVRPEKHYKIIFIKAPTLKASKYGGAAGSGGAFPQVRIQ